MSFVTVDAPTETRRDRWGRYLVVPPGGTKPVGYTRATTVSDTLSDKESLFAWSQVMAMTGMMRRPGLRGRFEALMSANPLDGPWYGGDAAKKEAKKIAAECKEAGGATDRADVGTSRHALIEQVIRGQQTLITQPETQADVDAFSDCVAASGMTIDPNLTEVIVVHDEWQIAGTADMLRVTVPGEGDFVGDLKTGTTLDFSHGAIAQQLAIYARANNIYVQGAAGDGSDDERLPMPELSTERALVFHLPAGEARCEIIWVDIAAGAEAVERALWTRQWRKRRDLFVPYNMPLTPAAAPAPVDDRRAALRARFAALVADDWTNQQRFVDRNIDPDDLDAIEDALDDLDPFSARNTAATAPPAPEPKPTPEPPVRPATVDTPPDEGGDGDPAAFEVLKQRFTDLEPAARSWISTIAADALRAGAPFGAGDTKTVRRFEIYRGLLAVAEHDLDERDELVRELVATAVESDTAFFPTFTLGHAVGAMHADEATRFAGLAVALCDDVTSVDLRRRPAA